MQSRCAVNYGSLDCQFTLEVGESGKVSGGCGGKFCMGACAGWSAKVNGVVSSRGDDNWSGGKVKNATIGVLSVQGDRGVGRLEGRTGDVDGGK